MNALALSMVFIVATGAPFLIMPISIIMSSLYETSAQFQYNLKQAVNTVSNTNVMNYWKLALESCPVVRCKVGSLYYMEAKAKLTLLQRLVDGIIFLLVNAK